MKKIFLTLLLPLLWSISFAQDKEGADKLVDEGIAYHDKGDFEGAISRYDKALAIDKDNLLALAEKAFSLISLQRYEEAISFCQKAIAAHPGDKDLKTVYVTYGNAYDALKKTDKSIEVYEEGIKQFPDFYQLHFNKGITLSTVQKYDEAILCFEKSLLLNPKHPGSHNALARVSYSDSKRIPSLLAISRFMVLEPKSGRAKENLTLLQKIMKSNVEEKGKKSITINISSDILADTAKNGKPLENSFTSTELLLTLDAALDYDKKNKKKTEVEQFIRKFETVCSSLSETKKDNYGFFWDYYVPYFVEMKEKNFIETFGYIAYASSDDPTVAKWLKEHKIELELFFAWNKNFKWKSN